MLRSAVGRTAGLVAMTALAVVTLFPVVWALVLSFRRADQQFVPIWESPTAFTLTNIGETLTSEFISSLINSFVVASATTVIALALGIPAGFALSKGRLTKGYIYSWLLLVLRMAPPVGFVIPLFLLYIELDLIDSRPGLIAAYVPLTLPLATWSLWTTFNQVPDSLFEAALVDGATVGQAIRRVVLPAAAPGLVAAGVLSFLIAWNDFFFALVITRRDTATAPVAIMNFLGYANINWGSIAVATVALTLPAIPIAFLASRYVVKSLAGSVKG